MLIIGIFQNRNDKSINIASSVLICDTKGDQCISFSYAP